MQSIKKCLITTIVERLNYDPQTGEMTWKSVQPHSRSKVGDVVGCIHNNGYRRVYINGKLYQTSRLAFVLMTGDWPTFEVDHINRNRSDDRWDNLRDVTRSVNQRNKGKYLTKKPNKYGVKGVFKQGNKWGLRGQNNLYLGTYSCLGCAKRVSDEYWQEVENQMFN